jgi:proteasome accessory factor B
VSQKSERLVNLTIALLATKRYLTKAEIFNSVAGYSGDIEARDRMFERDKDDLRSLGIEIELGTFDPLFEDEAGYRIKRDSYSFQISDLNSDELFLLSAAALAWQGASLAESSQDALRKLKSIGIGTTEFENQESYLAAPESHESLPLIVEALTGKFPIEFTYPTEEAFLEVRHVAPYRIKRRENNWYLIALDLDKRAIRTFRLDRLASEVTLTKGGKVFEIDDQLLAKYEISANSPSIAQVKVRSGLAQSLRNRASEIEIGDEWDLLTITYFDVQELIRSILWHGENAELVNPKDAREQLIAQVKAAVTLHG